MRKRRLATPLFLLVCLVSASQSNTETVLLKFNLQKGKVYAYSMNTETYNEVQGQKLSSKMSFDYTMRVLDDKAAVTTVSITYDHIAIKINSSAANVDFDTNTPRQDSAVDFQQNPMAMIGTMINAMKGKTFQMKLTDKGEITEVTGMKELSESVANSFSGDEKMKAVVKQAFQTQFSEESVKQSFSQSFNLYPDNPVRVGDSWQKEMRLPGPTAGKMNTTYTVKEIKPDRVALDMNATISTGAVNGIYSGMLEVDRKTGFIINTTMIQQFDAPVNLRNTITIKGKEI